MIHRAPHACQPCWTGKMWLVVKRKGWKGWKARYLKKDMPGSNAMLMEWQMNAVVRRAYYVTLVEDFFLPLMRVKWEEEAEVASTSNNLALLI